MSKASSGTLRAGAAPSRRSVAAVGGAVTEDELTILQRRFAALESETTSAAPGKSVSRLQTTRATAEALSKDPAHADELAELKRLDDQVCQLRRKHDELAHANMEKRQELKRTENKLHDINKESVKGGANADPRQRELRELERKLQEAVVRYEDAYDTRRTCDQIMKRLTEERIGYDNTIAELDNRLKAKELEYEELLLLSHDANTSKEAAKAELSRLEALAAEERKLRDREVHEQKTLVAQKLEVNKALTKRASAAAALSSTPANTMPLELPEGARRNQLYLQLGADSGIDEETRNIRAYEHAFQQIRGVTGVSDVSEVIEKFLTQEETHKNLQQLTRDSQERIEQLYAQRRKADETLQRLRYTSSKPAPSRRPARALAPAGEGVSAAQSKYERMRNKHEHMKAVFLSVRAGIGNLARQLDADRMLDKLPLEEMGAREMAALLDEAGARAGALLGAIEMEEEAMRAASSTVATASAQPAQAAMVSASELELGPGNIRIKDPTERDDDAQEDDDDFEEDLEEDVVDRSALKKQSAAILDRANKGKKKRRRRDVAAADEEEK